MTLLELAYSQMKTHSQSFPPAPAASEEANQDCLFTNSQTQSNFTTIHS